MKLFSLFTKTLQFLPSEVAHYIALAGLKVLHDFGLLRLLYKPLEVPKTEVSVKELIKSSNRVGIAAGLDKNGDYIDCLAALGIGFIEVGTVTPRPQKGNPKPRIFRDLGRKAILNRLGFNNKGVDHLVERLRTRRSNIVVGSRLGKNFDTPNHNAHEDYLICLDKVYGLSDYVAINISSPNTKDLRKLTDYASLNFLLRKLKSKQNKLSLLYGYRPIFIKLSPDENLQSLKEICESIIINELDGIICSNTTVDHDNKNSPGGLSGAPLKDKSTECLVNIKNIVGNKLPIIASGGVMSVSDYQEKIDAGADLVQLYTGFIYEGPKLINDIVVMSKNK